MKKSVVFVASVLLFLALFPLISASTNSTVADKGYACLQNKTADCSSLSLEQQIFTSLATGICTNYVENSTTSSNCWAPTSYGSCEIKTTSEAMLALNSQGISVNGSASWLLSQNQSTSNLINWYLQIDSNKPATCTITYPSQSSAIIHIDAGKTIRETSAGNCFARSDNGYWLQVDPSCFGENFKVSCNESFTTTKLYQRTPASSYPTVYVSSSSQSSSPSPASVTESFGSYCFGSGAGCDYESTLWATLVLNKLNYSINSYLPYLTVEAGNPVSGQYSQYLPYAFLYMLTSSPNYLTNLLAAQSTVNQQHFWYYSQDQYFGTSLALIALKSSSDSTDTNNAISWLESLQQSDGCWHNNDVLNTAFILYSMFGPRNLASSPGVTTQNCSGVGYCLSNSVCTNQAGGTSLGGNYNDCSISQICCTKNYQPQTCTDQGGNLCSSNQICNGTKLDSSDSTSSQFCCSGTCETQSTPTTALCANVDGTCRNSCLSNEIKLSGSCTSGQVCCGTSTISNSFQNQNKNLVWIILLSVLIVLSVIAIIFHKKLALWFKSKFGKGGKRSGGPSGPRGPPNFPPRSPPPSFRRPMPHQGPAPRSSKEVGDVLKRLKEMGK